VAPQIALVETFLKDGAWRDAIAGTVEPLE
jgi:hypothetical protein